MKRKLFWVFAIVLVSLCAGIIATLTLILCNKSTIIDFYVEDIPETSELRVFRATETDEILLSRQTAVDGKYIFQVELDSIGDNELVYFNIWDKSTDWVTQTKRIYVLPNSKVKVRGSGSEPILWNVESKHPNQKLINILDEQTGEMIVECSKISEQLFYTKEGDDERIVLQKQRDELNEKIDLKIIDILEELPKSDVWILKLYQESRLFKNYERCRYVSKAQMRDRLWKLYERLSDEEKHGEYGIGIAFCLTGIKELMPGDAMIDLELFDTGNNTHNLSDFKGKWLLLDFSDYYCGYCHALCPTLKYLSETYGSGLQLITISNDSENNFKKMVEEDGITWPAFYNQDAYSKYGISGRPTFVLISPEGVIAERIVGANPDWLLKTFLKYSENANPRIVKTEGIATIELPSITGGINGFSIEKIALYPDSTLVSFVYLDLSNNYSIGSGSVLRCSDGTVCKAISSSIGFDNYVDRKQVVRFNATFEPLPEGVESFDYVEGDCDNCFVKGVKVAGY